MSQGIESSTYRRAAYLQAKRLGQPLPAAPPPAPSKPLSPEYRRALQHQAQRLNLPAPRFDCDGREIPPPAAATLACDPWAGAGLPNGLVRTSAPLASAPAPVTAAPGKPLSSMDRRAMYLNDIRNAGFEGQRMPDGTIWKEEISRSNLK
jgi:hypothetical protein